MKKKKKKEIFENGNLCTTKPARFFQIEYMVTYIIGINIFVADA